MHMLNMNGRSMVSKAYFAPIYSSKKEFFNFFDDNKTFWKCI